MLINFETKKLKMINDLARISTAVLEDQINKYTMELNAEEQCIYIEQHSRNGNVSVSMKIDDTSIKEDAEIPIYDTNEFKEILNIIDDDLIDIRVEKKKVIIETSKDIINLPSYERTNEEIESIESLKSLFTSRDFGNKKCYFIGHIDKETNKPKPDATVKIDLNSINLKKIRSVFNKGLINIIVKDNTFLISIGTGKRKQNKNITKTISKKDNKDPMFAKGECSIYLQDINCFNLLSSYEGYTHIDMKKNIPILIKRIFTKERIGVCYIVSIREEN
jgi:hypothetical protein